MVIGDLDAPRRAVQPFETHSPLIVDANAPLPGAVAGQFLQPGNGWNAQIVNPYRSIEHLQFVFRHGADVHEAWNRFNFEQGLRIGAFEEWIMVIMI